MRPRGNANVIRFSNRWRFAVWFIYLMICFAATHTPRGDRVLIPSFMNDTAMHFTGYVVLGALSVWMAGAAAHERRRTLLLWMALCLYAAFDEITQLLVGRSCELIDWLADAVGALIGSAAAVAVMRRRLTRSREPALE